MRQLKINVFSAPSSNSYQKVSDTEGGFQGLLHDEDWFGHSLANLGDIDSDGIIDLAVGAETDDDGGPERGAVWILSLNKDGTVKSHQKISDTAGGFSGVLMNSDFFGVSLARLGDLDNDNVPELAVGALNDDGGGQDRGAIWVLFLNSDGSVKTYQKISDVEGNFTGQLDNQDRFGRSVTNLGDVDGNGVDDLLVGSDFDDDGGENQGAVWLLYLNKNGMVKAHHKISETNGNFTGTLNPNDNFGIAVAGLGDINQDNGVDFAVGAWHDDDGAIDAGAAWIFFTTLCTYSISPTSQAFSASGGTDSVNVMTVETNCEWTAVSNDTNWIKITSGSNGKGNGTVNYLVAVNNNSNSRRGTMTIAGNTFTVTQSGTTATRNVRIVDSNASAGSTVNVPIELIAEGDENALGFSLEFNISILNNPQATLGRDATAATLNTNSSQINLGRYGIALALPAGATFSAGIREIVVVSFTVANNTQTDSTQIVFVDQPIAREVVDANANVLPTTWTSGVVRIFRGYEADVAPRPNGNNDGKVTIADWVQVGRFSARLDTPRTDVNEFQRADCAPKPCGDGRIGISDWVQAGRYAARLDPVVTACGPLSPSALTANADNSVWDERVKNFELNSTRTVRAVSTSFRGGLIDSLLVELDAQGNENALGFSLVFDPNVLTFMELIKGSGASNVTLIPNTQQAANGRLGIALALPAEETFIAGIHNIVVITFTVHSGVSTDSTMIGFDDQPIGREIVDANANILTADWISTKVAIITSVKENSGINPLSFELSQNYPNPFNPVTCIEFSIPRTGYIILKVFNLVGEEVASLLEKQLPAGRYKINWDATGLESGIYFYQFRVGEFVQTRKLILMK